MTRCDFGVPKLEIMRPVNWENRRFHHAPASYPSSSTDGGDLRIPAGTDEKTRTIGRIEPAVPVHGSSAQEVEALSG